SSAQIMQNGELMSHFCFRIATCVRYFHPEQIIDPTAWNDDFGKFTNTHFPLRMSSGVTLVSPAIISLQTPTLKTWIIWVAYVRIYDLVRSEIAGNSKIQ